MEPIRDVDGTENNIVFIKRMPATTGHEEDEKHMSQKERGNCLFSYDAATISCYAH